MAEIKAFKALRFTEKAGDVSQLVCPPYDIISDTQRQEYINTNDNNIIRLELPRDGANPYTVAGEKLQEMLHNKILAKDAKDGIYIYEEKFTVHNTAYSIKGIICHVKVEDFSKGVVLPHEETLSKAKEDRFNLMCATNCNFSQIYSMYNDDNDTRQKINAASLVMPDISFTDDEMVTHNLWYVSDPLFISQIQNDFTNRKLYIADGHHRYETAIRYRNHIRSTNNSDNSLPSDYVMMYLIDMENPGLVVFPTHRIVRDLPDFNMDALIKNLSADFDIIPNLSLSDANAKLAACADNKKAFAVTANGENFYLLTLKSLDSIKALLPNKCTALQELDVTVLHSLILEKYMGIDKENMANQINLTYTRVESEAIDAAKTYANCVFLINATKVSEIRDVSLAGEKMPQKSTYFYPKLITGLVINEIN